MGGSADAFETPRLISASPSQHIGLGSRRRRAAPCLDERLEHAARRVPAQVQAPDGGLRLLGRRAGLGRRAPRAACARAGRP